MPAVPNCCYERLRQISTVSAIPALLRPLQHSIPMIAESMVSVYLLQTRLLQFSHSDQILQIMCMTSVHGLLVGKVVTLCSSGDAGFQSTFDGVACQIIRPVGKAGVQQCRCLSKSGARKELQILPVHATHANAAQCRLSRNSCPWACVAVGVWKGGVLAGP